jgi:cytochrome P450
MHPHWIQYWIMKEYPELEQAGAFYTDSWPVWEPILIVIDPDMMAQFTQETSLPKGPHFHRGFYPFTENRDLVSSEGQQWKKWRARFNPAFSTKNLTALIPAMLEEVLVFRDWMKRAAEKAEVFLLEDHIMNMTIDVMGRAIL